MSYKVMQDAKLHPRDEYYTLMEDIVAEISSYPASVFKGKIVYCNCDGPTSNFYKFFKANFAKLGLKKLICTSISGWGCVITPGSSRTLKLKDGDFRSPECLKYLAEADLVVTNPPFSLLRTYIPLMMKYHKKFLIIAPQSITHYVATHSFFANGQIDMGNHAVRGFVTPAGEYKKFGNTYWFTNLPRTTPKKALALSKKAGPYRKYDEYDAINIPNIKSIPADYRGIMGVPEGIFLKDWEKDFKVVGSVKPHIRGKATFHRILIQRK